MNTHTPRREHIAPLVAACLFALVAAFGFASSEAQTPQEAASAQDEREFKSKIPEHMPIRAKLKSEKSFKDLKNKRWLRQFEVEVKNTGSKPIYYLNFTLGLTDVSVGGYPLVVTMIYGRDELFYPETELEPGDVPILPGESATLKVNERKVKAYEYGRDEVGDRSDPRGVEFYVDVIRFGDGTSLWGRDGKLPPMKPGFKPANVPKPEGGAAGCRSSPALSTTDAPSGLFNVSTSWQPASLLRAYLLAPVEAPALAAAPDDCGCHSVSGCMWGKLEPRHNCQSCETKMAVIFVGGCGNSGQCLAYTTITEDCPAESDPTLKCTWDQPTNTTCYLSDPTPTPTPSPTPTPACTPSSPEPVPCCEPEEVPILGTSTMRCRWNCRPPLLRPGDAIRRRLLLRDPGRPVCLP